MDYIYGLGNRNWLFVVQEHGMVGWCENWRKLFPEANKHEIDMLEGKYGAYAKGGLIRRIEEGKYNFGTMT